MIPSLLPAAEKRHGKDVPRIQEKDLVIVYENINSMKAVHVDPNARYDNRFGSFPQKEWIGLPFGSKVRACGGSRGWAYLLAPTPDLWSLVLRHRTQILYIADISMICMYLELCPGAIVLESGTGSGSLTHSLVRAVAPTGHVYSFEHHLERANEAAAEVRANGLASCVTIRHRDVEGSGFPRGQQQTVEGDKVEGASGPGVAAQGNGSNQDAYGKGPSNQENETQGSEGKGGKGGSSNSLGTGVQGAAGGDGGRGEGELNLTGIADAVFLDLPAPLKVIPSAAICLKPNGRLCSFSPCIEQVQNVCRALELAGFTDIMTVECLLRTHEVRAERIDTLKPSAPQQQLQQPQQSGPLKRVREEQEGEDQGVATGDDAGANGGNQGPDGETAMSIDKGDAGQAQGEAPVAPSERALRHKQEARDGAQGGVASRQQGSTSGWQAEAKVMVSSCPMQQARGHTGYLTFARKWVG